MGIKIDFQKKKEYSMKVREHESSLRTAAAIHVLTEKSSRCFSRVCSSHHLHGFRSWYCALPRGQGYVALLRRFSIELYVPRNVEKEACPPVVHEWIGKLNQVSPQRHLQYPQFIVGAVEVGEDSDH